MRVRGRGQPEVCAAVGGRCDGRRGVVDRQGEEAVLRREQRDGGAPRRHARRVADDRRDRHRLGRGGGADGALVQELPRRRRGGPPAADGRAVVQHGVGAREDGGARLREVWRPRLLPLEERRARRLRGGARHRARARRRRRHDVRGGGARRLRARLFAAKNAARRRQDQRADAQGARAARPAARDPAALQPQALLRRPRRVQDRGRRLAGDAPLLPPVHAAAGACSGQPRARRATPPSPARPRPLSWPRHTPTHTLPRPRPLSLR